MPQNDYFSLLRIAGVLVGNSSSGIRESSSFKLPVVNIGTRQDGRERASNVIDVNHERREIAKAIQYAIYDEEFKNKLNHYQNPYGDGKAGLRIADKLSEVKIDRRLLQKKISY